MYQGLASTHEDMAFYTVNNIENLLQTAKATDSDGKERGNKKRRQERQIW